MIAVFEQKHIEQEVAAIERLQGAQTGIAIGRPPIRQKTSGTRRIEAGVSIAGRALSCEDVVGNVAQDGPAESVEIVGCREVIGDLGSLGRVANRRPARQRTAKAPGGGGMSGVIETCGLSD